MSITQLALSAYGLGLGVGAVIMSLMSSYQAVRSSLRDLDF